jgi:hypothetical protein
MEWLPVPVTTPSAGNSRRLHALPGMQAHFNLGNVFRQCGHFEAAVYCYEMVTDAVPGHWRGLLSLAVAHMGLGHAAEAQRHLRAAFKASGALHTPVLARCTFNLTCMYCQSPLPSLA